MAAVEAAVADRAVPSAAAFPLVAVIEVAAALLVAAEAVAVFLVEAAGGPAVEVLTHSPVGRMIGDIIRQWAAESRGADLARA